tara:strand:- start:2183 stop:2455 length:273 start_codon:yes stop_codon:yes gene_type:complete
MSYFVYLIISKKNSKILSYVGYSNNLAKRIELHNKGKGAKFTRGKKWKLIYKKKYNSKHTAMVEEYKLKKNYKLRNLIKLNYQKKFNNNI